MGRHARRMPVFLCIVFRLLMPCFVRKRHFSGFTNKIRLHFHRSVTGFFVLIRQKPQLRTKYPAQNEVNSQNILFVICKY